MKKAVFLVVGALVCGLVWAASSPVSKTGQTTRYAPGDDGDVQTGTQWPDPRFTSMTNGTDITVLDNLTGLEWIQAPHSLSGNSGAMVWNSAIDFCNGLDYAGHADWRLPSRRELMSLVDYGRYNPALPTGHPFSGVRSSYYWSGTSYAYDTALAWGVGMGYGGVNYNNEANDSFAWPVRGGQ